MATLNKRMRAIVLQNVERFGKGCEIVRPEDFHVTFDADGVGFTIRYLHDDAYSFRVESDGNLDRMHTIEAPGKATTADESHRSWDKLQTATVEWARRVDEELKALPHIRRLAEATARIEDLEEQLESVPERYATKDELEELRRRLDDLERQATETLQTNEGTAEDIAAAVTRLHADIEALKEAAPNMSFRAIARWVGVRFWRYSKSPNAGTEISNVVETMRALTEAATKNASG